MTRLALALALALGLAAPAPAQAACYADYTASQSDPYDLHYGVAEITGSCTVADATQELRGRLAEAGWQLLAVRGTFDRAGAESRRDDAGNFYLRY
jgi:hypothetical protein